MTEFFGRNMDYVFFVFGLIFILLAALCRGLTYEDSGRLPWRWLGAFGLFHGLTKWLDMLALSQGDSLALRAGQVIFLLASVIALVEFGRRSLLRDGRPIVGVWLAPGLCVLAAMGALADGLDGFNAGARYALGIPGSILAMLALASIVGPEEDIWKRRGLVLSACCIFFFGVAEVVVPPARFDPASWLNHDTFFHALGFPIQLMQACGMAGVMTGFWIYRQRLTSGAAPQHRGIPWLTPLVFVGLLVLGWYASEQRGASKDAEQHDRLLEQASALARAINPEDVKTFAFLDSDQHSPHFIRMQGHLIAMGHVLPCRGIYTLAIRNGQPVFGPNTFAQELSAAASSSAMLRKTCPDDLTRFTTRAPFTIGPDRIRAGSVISAFAPICDPRTGAVLMHIGIDMPTENWQARIARVRLMPIAGAMVLVLAMLVGIDLIGRRDRLQTGNTGVLRHLESILVALCGVVITLIFALLIRESEIRQRQSIFDRFAESRGGQIRDELITIRADLSSLSLFFESSQEVTPYEFGTFAGTMRAADAVEAFAWVPIVQTDKQDAVLTEAHRYGMTNFTIWESPEPGKRSPATGRPRLFPIYYVEPSEEHEAVHGFDMGSEPIRRQILEAGLRNALPSATPALSLIHQADRQPAVLLFNPVYAMKPDSLGKPPLRGEMRGFTAGVVRFQNLLLRASGRAGLSERFLDLDLLDLTDPHHTGRLATHPEIGRPAMKSILDEMDRTDLVNLQPIFAFGRTYAVISHPSNSFHSAYPLYANKRGAAGGLLLTGILTLFVGFLRTRQVSMEQEVRQRTAAFREAQENLAVTLNSIGDGVIATDSRSRIKQMNPAAERLTGWTREEAFDKFLPEVFHVINGQTRHPMGNPVDLVLFSGTIVALANHSALIARDGRERHISDSAAPIRDASGVVTGVVLVFSDVTEQYAAQLRLEESEQQYRMLAEHASDVISRFSLSGLFLYISPSCRTMFGFEPDEIIGKHMPDFVHPDDQVMLAAGMKTVFSTNEPVSATYRYRHKNGSYRWVETTGKRVMDTILNIPLEGIAVSRDITERKHAEELRLEMERRLLHSQKLESLGILAGGIAHDFNNLLTAVLGNLELAQTDLGNNPQARFSVDQAVHAAKRAADLTRQMLAYSGKGLFAVTELSLNELVEENAHMLKAAISKTITLNLDLAPRLQRIRADAGQIQQIVMNLITNASEAIGDRAGTVTLSTGVRKYDAADLASSRLPEKPEPGRFVWIEVADTGCGMDEDIVSRIFEPFFTTKFTGRGLGMSAVLGIVRGHNGAIFLDTRPGLGTTIRVLFPVSAKSLPVGVFNLPLEPVTQEPPPPPSHAKDAFPATILVVDDEQIVCNICANFLNRNGYRTLLALDGEEGVRVFREHADEIMAVILDLTMPKMDGATAFREMKRIRPDVKVILSSGHAEQEALRHFAGQGISGFLQKPYTLAVLLSELEKITNERSA
jgi:PAS domain S-box-containing protein